MDRVEQLLVEELDCADGAPQLLPDRVLGHVRGVRRRRRRAALGAATAVLAIAAATVGAARPWHDRQPAAGVPAGYRFSELDSGGFADRDRGYLLTTYCDVLRPAPGQTRHCALRLSATADGGASWIDRPLPMRSRFTVSGDGMELLDGTPLLKVAPSGMVVLRARSEDRWWSSTDGGRSWHARRGRPPTTASIPPGSVLSGYSDDRGTAVQVLSPTGVSLLTSRDPAVEHTPASAVVAASDGSFWLPCRPARTSTEAGACVSVTSDGGRTWRTIRPRDSAAELWSTVDTVEVCTVDGRTVFVHARLTRQASQGGSETSDVLLRSADGGVTWHRVQLPDADRSAPGSPIVSVVMSDGGDLVVGFLLDQPYRLPAGGDGFEPLPAAPAGAFGGPASMGAYLAVWRPPGVDGTRFGSLTPSAEPGSPTIPVYLSGDGGTSWHAIRLR